MTSIASSGGEGLVFVAGLPRSGTTLLQRSLMAHPDVTSRSETWLMLHPAHALRWDGLRADFDHGLARLALEDLTKALGRSRVVESMARGYADLYDILGEGHRWFVDKTPRYYLIIDELLEFFPQARVVLMVRNPLAILHSILTSWVGDDWFRLSAYRVDLEQGFARIAEAVSKADPRIAMVHFEDLLADPAAELRRVCDHLELQFDDRVLQPDASESAGWMLGDDTALRGSTAVVRDRATRFDLEPWTAQQWRCSRDLLAMIRDHLATLGQDEAQLSAMVDRHAPSGPRRLRTLPLRRLLELAPQDRSLGDRLQVRLRAG